jgi:hypothetical protein
VPVQVQGPANRGLDRSRWDLRCWAGQGWRSFALGVLLLVLVAAMAAVLALLIWRSILGRHGLAVDVAVVSGLGLVYLKLLSSGVSSVLDSYARVLQARNQHPSLPLRRAEDR